VIQEKSLGKRKLDYIKYSTNESKTCVEYRILSTPRLDKHHYRLFPLDLSVQLMVLNQAFIRASAVPILAFSSSELSVHPIVGTGLGPHPNDTDSFVRYLWRACVYI
jgi:hypothetical protein